MDSKVQNRINLLERRIHILENLVNQLVNKVFPKPTEKKVPEWIMRRELARIEENNK